MTILYTLISTDPFAGSTKSFLILLEGVLKAGIKVVIVIPDTNGIHDTLIKMGAHVIVQAEKGCTWTGAKNFKQTVLYVPRQLGRMAVNYRACQSLEKKLKDVDINLVHSNVSISLLGRYIAKRRRLPHIYHFREYGDKDFGLRYFPSNASFHRSLKKRGDYSVCITKDIQRHHGLDGLQTSRVIYNGIIDGTEQTELTTEQREYLLYAGRIEPTKGLLTLVRAYHSYCTRCSSPLPLKVGGEVIDDNYMSNVMAYINRHHLDGQIEFLGKVIDMERLYRHAIATIVPSECEGFGRCMPEAMTYGSLVIAHNTGGSKEQFDNGLELTGKEIGFRYDSEEELTERLTALHHLQEGELTEMRQRAHHCVCKLYSYDTYIASMLDFYKEILESCHNNIPVKAPYTSKALI